MSKLTHFLQSLPNAGIMQLFILLIVIVVVVLFIQFLQAKPPANLKLDSLSNENENLVTNKDIRLAGFELMSAGKSLLLTLIIVFGAIPINILIAFIIKIYNTSYADPYTVTTPIPMMEILIIVYVIISIVALVKLIHGYQHIKKAGEHLFKK